MTVISLQAESTNANPCEFENLYRSWRVAKAQWDLASYDPENLEGMTCEEEAAFCEAEHAAQTAFLLHPTSDLKHLARKLRVIREQQAWQYTLAPLIIDQLSRDIHDLAFGHDGE